MDTFANLISGPILQSKFACWLIYTVHTYCTCILFNRRRQKGIGSKIGVKREIVFIPDGDQIIK